MLETMTEKAIKEAVKQERRRIVQAIQGLPNRDEIVRLIFPAVEFAEKKPMKWVDLSRKAE